MAYCTQDDIKKLIPEQELAELTTESGSVPDADVVAEAISRADAEIDSYLGGRYATPLTGVPARVKAISVDIATFYLYLRRAVVPEVWEKNYERAVMFLQSVARGEAVILDVGREAAGATTSLQVVEFESAERVFNRETMGNW